MNRHALISLMSKAGLSFCLGMLVTLWAGVASAADMKNPPLNAPRKAFTTEAGTPLETATFAMG
jgi:hypothetical protein